MIFELNGGSRAFANCGLCHMVTIHLRSRGPFKSIEAREGTLLMMIRVKSMEDHRSMMMMGEGKGG